ncbi:hypothetical protein LAV72_12130 [Lysinibacillus xylanilyticus]|uniref:hypothetical protein n=1 Tax=Lysinibacillus xylanilyticus TaxID=582475 RepID=UPI002B249E88|nr:hypothetical protein [Lysinibacillus xylanilyticus]MEB2300363.1 hypothetical protein [Lysinibacillus xylanilyticus]
MNYYHFETSKMKKIIFPTFVLTLLSQLIFTYFFVIVGRFDGDDILTSYPAIISLASTITMCIISVYGAVAISRYIVNNYVGDNRNRVFLYPIKRSRLYLIKNIVFGCIFGLSQFVALLLVNSIFFIGETIFPILDKPIKSYWLDFIFVAVVCVLLTLSIVLFSSFIGIYFASTMYTVITCIISIVVVANVSALSLINYQFAASLGALCVLLAMMPILRNVSKRIDKSETL